MRGYIKDGISAAVKNVKATLNAYLLAKADNPPKAEFINMSKLATFQTTPPNDYSYWQLLWL